MTMTSKVAAGLIFLGCFSLAPAQRGGGPTETWWVNKTQGGVYHAPNRPLWRLADLKQMHAGQNNWSEPIIKDPEQEATYNSAAPGSKFGRRLHPDTHTLFVVIAGEIRFEVEGHEPVNATRGSVVNILKSTVFSYEVGGSEIALWVHVNPANFQTVYPSADPAPPAPAGQEMIKVAFRRTPATYTDGNQLHWNLFEAAAKCDIGRVHVNEDGLFLDSIYGFANENDPLDKCPNSQVRATPSGEFEPNSIFGHMHAGPAEWWIVPVGGIVGRFEGAGEFHAKEGDVLYAAPMTWHQMGYEGDGPSCRLALGGYRLVNMGNTAGASDQ